MNGGALVVAEVLLIGLPAVALAAEHAVGHGVRRAVDRRAVQRGIAGLALHARALHRLFHLLRNEEGNGRENKRNQRQTRVVGEQHHGVRRQRHAGIEQLGGEFAHALHAVVHVGDRLGHDAARALCLERRPIHAHEMAVQHALHAAVDVVGEAAHIKALDIARPLHHRGDQRVNRDQRRHIGKARLPVQHVDQPAGHAALEQRPGQQPDVIDQPRHGNDQQRRPFRAEIRADPVRTKSRLTHRSPLPQSAGGTRESPRGSLSCICDRACPASRRTPPFPRRPDRRAAIRRPPPRCSPWNS